MREPSRLCLALFKVERGSQICSTQDVSRPATLPRSKTARMSDSTQGPLTPWEPGTTTSGLFLRWQAASAPQRGRVPVETSGGQLGPYLGGS